MSMLSPRSSIGRTGPHGEPDLGSLVEWGTAAHDPNLGDPIAALDDLELAFPVRPEVHFSSRLRTQPSLRIRSRLLRAGRNSTVDV